jgi:ribokinase
VPAPADARFDVCVVGSANLDLVATTGVLPRPGETVLGTAYAEHAGGKGLNQAVAAARAGARTAFVGAVGDDDAGARLLAELTAAGVDTSATRRQPGPTGRALITVDAGGENSIVVVAGANGTVAVEHLPPASVLLVQLEVPLSTVADALAQARRAGTTTILNPAPVPAAALDAAFAADLVVPNEREVEALGGAAALLLVGARAVVTTMGAAGAEVHASDGVRHHSPFAVAPVDTTGAGDAFCGALAARIAAGDDLDAAVRFACAAGALATTEHGAVPSLPDLDAIETLLRPR